jgi:hypothetical protein
MADFVTEHKKNVRYSVNRSEKILIKLAEVELNVWLRLVEVLQERRNTGPQIETFLYLLRKYKKLIKPAKIKGRAEWKTVARNKCLLFKVNKDENKLWLNIVKKHCSSKVNAFIYIMDKEFNFQDNLEIINEK